MVNNNNNRKRNEYKLISKLSTYCARLEITKLIYNENN